MSRFLLNRWDPGLAQTGASIVDGCASPAVTLDRARLAPARDGSPARLGRRGHDRSTASGPRPVHHGYLAGRSATSTSRATAGCATPAATSRADRRLTTVAARLHGGELEPRPCFRPLEFYTWDSLPAGPMAAAATLTRLPGLLAAQPGTAFIDADREVDKAGIVARGVGTTARSPLGSQRLGSLSLHCQVAAPTGCRRRSL